MVALPIARWLDGSGSSIRWSQLGHSTELAALPVLVYWAINLVFYGVGEELGWRGFLQPRLEGRWPVVTAECSQPFCAAWHILLSGITPSYRAMPVIGFLGLYFSIWVAWRIFAWLRGSAAGAS